MLRFRMEKRLYEEKGLSEKIRAAGFGSLDEFVRGNLHYLPKDEQDLFYGVEKCSGVVGESDIHKSENSNQSRYFNCS